MSAGTPAAEAGPFIAPGATLGVVGGGQLGRMFVHAAQQHGYLTVVLDPDAASPAGAVAHEQLRADYLDAAALRTLADRCAAVTTEFENVPAAALRQLAERRPVAPGADAVSICQDRATEKAHFVECGVRCAPYATIETAGDLAGVGDDLLPGILKTARMGYDGKGQVRVPDRSALDAAWHELSQGPCVLEKMLPIVRELSVIVARNAAGEIVALPVQQNLHRDGILAVTQVPAPDVDAAMQQHAVDSARELAASMHYVGVLCVEFFVVGDAGGGTLLIANEMAPRPHNSGHYSVDACDVSQYDLQLRALTGAPLVTPRLHSPAVMLNLLGDLWFDAAGAAVEPPWDAVLALPGAHLHLYGKVEARPGRKMGHLTLTAGSGAAATTVALRAAALLGLSAF